ncbi:sensory neuron membrane protein 1-like [Bacillus rossius redtenbacheri]|uniref:sensory neuron membrane protein 1-like n=1 Tax=Bacillus rossius redtenbacheri TaxID=93214 RepID=UPI002FDEFC8C
MEKRGVRSYLTRTPCVAAAAASGALLTLLGACLGWVYMPAELDRQVVERVVLKDDSPAFELWRVLPQPLVAKFYLFNVTNPAEVQSGARPVLQEVGPYVYDEYLEKVNIEKHQDSGTISYNLKSTFIFNPELSGEASTSDNVTILNLPLLGTALKVKRLFPFALKLMDPVLAEIFPSSGSVFLTGSVAEVLFDGLPVVDCSSNTSDTAGMVCEQLDGQLPENVQRTSDDVYKFSFYGYKNGTSTGRFTVDRGLADARRLAEVVAYDGENSTAAWGDPRCDRFGGTDGLFFPPLRSPGDPLLAFSPDICRTVTLKYEQKTRYRGLPVLRYVNDPALLQDPGENPDNKCYCAGRPGRRTCLKGGVLDLSPCIGFSVILSYPHLYMADPEYLKYAVGMSPARRRHETFLEVEPRTGVPLRGSKKVQLNMFLTRIPEVTVFRNVSEGLFPAMWLDEGIEVNDKNLVLLRTLNNVVNTVYTTRWMAIILGLALCAAACMACYSRKKNCGSYDNRVVPFKGRGTLNMGFEHDGPVKVAAAAAQPPDVTRTCVPAVDTRRKGSTSPVADSRREGSPDSPGATVSAADGSPARPGGADSDSVHSSAEDTKSTSSLRSVDEAKIATSAASPIRGPGECADGDSAR